MAAAEVAAAVVDDGDVAIVAGVVVLPMPARPFLLKDTEKG